MNALHRALLRVRPAFLTPPLKRLFRIRRRTVETLNGRFYLDPVTHFASLVTRPTSYEPDLVEAVRAILRPGDVFVDVGANEGYFSIIAGKAVGPTGRVIAVEPQSRLQSVIARNVKENAVPCVQVFQRAISDSIGVAELFVAPDRNSGSSGLSRATRYKVPTESVLQTTLGDFFRLLKLESVRLMKMDIEGFEYEAVLGSRELFRSGVVEHFALELHPTILARRGKPEADIVRFLEECGYRRDERFRSHILTRR